MPALACSLLVATLAAAAVVEAAAGADGEVAAGRAPVDLNGEEENSITFTLVPGAALRLRSSTTSLLLSYAPRIFYRFPNALDVGRPLVLHQVSLAHSVDLSRIQSWGSSASLAFGELDYTGTGLVFPAGISTQLRQAVSNVVRVEGATGYKRQLSRRLGVAFDASAEYTTSPDDPVTSTFQDPGSTPEMPLPDVTITADPLPDSAQVTTEASLGYLLDRNDRLGTSAEVTYQWFPDSGRYLLLSPDVSWERQLNRRTTLGLSAGLAYVITLETTLDLDQSNSLGGTGSFQLASTLYSARRTTVSSGLNASLDWFFDPIAGTSQPRVGADLTTNIEIGREWLIAPSVSFYTVLRDQGTPATGAMTADGMVPLVVATPDATILRVELPFNYSVSQLVSLSFGGRAALRGKALSEDDFYLNEQVELWAFLGVTVRLATSKDDGSWLPL